MTAKRKTTEGKKTVKKLKLKRETLKDLDARGKGAKIKGGDVVVYATVGCTLLYCATAITNCGQATCATGNMFCRLK